jgi:predicted ATPase
VYEWLDGCTPVNKGKYLHVKELTMKTEDDIGILTSQLNEWHLQIADLAEKQQAAVSNAERLAKEIKELQASQCAATKVIRDSAAHKSALYIWENIGCGG